MKTLTIIIFLFLAGCQTENSFYRSIEKIGFEKQPQWGLPEGVVLYDYLRGNTFAQMEIKNGFWEIYDGNDYCLVGNGWVKDNDMWEVKHYLNDCRCNMPSGHGFVELFTISGIAHPNTYIELEDYCGRNCIAGKDGRFQIDSIYPGVYDVFYYHDSIPYNQEIVGVRNIVVGNHSIRNLKLK
jgi:hypothetical protein